MTEGGDLDRLAALANAWHEKQPMGLLRGGGVILPDEQPHYNDCRGCTVLALVERVRVLEAVAEAARRALLVHRDVADVRPFAALQAALAAAGGGAP